MTLVVRLGSDDDVSSVARSSRVPEQVLCRDVAALRRALASIVVADANDGDSGHTVVRVPGERYELLFASQVLTPREALWLLAGRRMPSEGEWLRYVCGECRCLRAAHQMVYGDGVEHLRALCRQLMRADPDGDDGCWTWAGKDVATLLWRGRRLTATRAAWQAFRDDPLPHRIDLTCGNAACVNPQHMAAAGRATQ